MRVTMVSVAAGRPGRANEDFAAAGPAAAVVVDGAGIPGSEAVCRHGVAWYAGRLGGVLLGLLPAGEDRSLPALLAEAIERVTDDHRGTCDVADPISPSAAVGIVRVTRGHVEHLVLGDCVAVIDRAGSGPVVVTDAREAAVSRSFEPLLAAVQDGGEEHRRLLRELRGHRNRAGGFWVAKDDPRAAGEAVTGRRPLSAVAATALLSNGASRIVDTFGLSGWPGVLAELAAGGAAAIVDRVRAAEARHGIAPDDATIVHCTGLGDR